MIISATPGHRLKSLPPFYVIRGVIRVARLTTMSATNDDLQRTEYLIRCGYSWCGDQHVPAAATALFLAAGRSDNGTSRSGRRRGKIISVAGLPAMMLTAAVYAPPGDGFHMIRVQSRREWIIGPPSRPRGQSSTGALRRFLGSSLQRFIR